MGKLKSSSARLFSIFVFFAIFSGYLWPNLYTVTNTGDSGSVNSRGVEKLVT